MSDCVWFWIMLGYFFKSHSDDSDKRTVPEIKSRGQVSSSLQKKMKDQQQGTQQIQTKWLETKKICAT